MSEKPRRKTRGDVLKTVVAIEVQCSEERMKASESKYRRFSRGRKTPRSSVTSKDDGVPSETLDRRDNDDQREV